MTRSATLNSDDLVSDEELGVTRESLVAKENLLWNKVQIFASSLSMMSSIFLAIRLAQLKELCVVCLSSHVINTSLFVIFFSRITAAKQKRD